MSASQWKKAIILLLLSMAVPGGLVLFIVLRPMELKCWGYALVWSIWAAASILGYTWRKDFES